MWDIFSFSFLADFWQTHGLWLMFFSAFLSATILPGNSEIVFVSPGCAKSIGRVIIKCGYFLACFSCNCRQYARQSHYLLDWSMVSENWQQKWPHFMGDKQNTTLWCYHFIIELVADCRGCVLCGSRLASIELAKLFNFLWRLEKDCVILPCSFSVYLSCP